MAQTGGGVEGGGAEVRQVLGEPIPVPEPNVSFAALRGKISPTEVLLSPVRVLQLCSAQVKVATAGLH